MARGALQGLGLGVALAGWGALLAATVLPQWETNSLAGGATIITAVATMQGLWMSCASQSTGQISCKTYDSLLALPAHLQATRGLMVVAAVLGPVALALALPGLSCVRCGDDDPRRKARVAAAGGGLFLVAGLSGLVACSWYAHRIITNFYDATVPVNLKYEPGPAIYLGWAGAALALLGGALLACSCAGGGVGQQPGLPPRQDPRLPRRPRPRVRVSAPRRGFCTQ